MTKDEALDLALEALELHGKQYPHMVKGYCLDAITAIKQARALDKKADNARELGLGYEPAQRKPLTDEQIAKEVEAELAHYWNGEYIDTTGARDQLTAFARAIEAAHGIEENT